ncbi:MAG: GNAT family protein [Caldilineaceae bacterium]
MHKLNYWQGDRIRLRALEPEDAQHFYNWNNTDIEVGRNLDWVWPPSSLTSQKKWAEAESQRRAENDEIFFVIENMDGELVGTINAHHCDRRVGAFSYGIAILDEHRQRGYASEAIRRLQAYFFWELRYQKVTVHVFSFNPASLALHQRLGFVQEGRMRRVLFTGGEYHDILIFGQTKEEFEETAGSRMLRDS